MPNSNNNQQQALNDISTISSNNKLSKRRPLSLGSEAVSSYFIKRSRYSVGEGSILSLNTVNLLDQSVVTSPSSRSSIKKSSKSPTNKSKDNNVSGGIERFKKKRQAASEGTKEESNKENHHTVSSIDFSILNNSASSSGTDASVRSAMSDQTGYTAPTFVLFNKAKNESRRMSRSILSDIHSRLSVEEEDDTNMTGDLLRNIEPTGKEDGEFVPITQPTQTQDEDKDESIGKYLESPERSHKSAHFLSPNNQGSSRNSFDSQTTQSSYSSVRETSGFDDDATESINLNLNEMLKDSTVSTLSTNAIASANIHNSPARKPKSQVHQYGDSNKETFVIDSPARNTRSRVRYDLEHNNDTISGSTPNNLSIGSPSKRTSSQNNKDMILTQEDTISTLGSHASVSSVEEISVRSNKSKLKMKDQDDSVSRLGLNASDTIIDSPAKNTRSSNRRFSTPTALGSNEKYFLPNNRRQTIDTIGTASMLLSSLNDEDDTANIKSALREKIRLSMDPSVMSKVKANNETANADINDGSPLVKKKVGFAVSPSLKKTQKYSSTPYRKLKQIETPRSTRRVNFGTPEVAEYNKNSPSGNITPLPSESARKMYSMQGNTAGLSFVSSSDSRDVSSLGRISDESVDDSSNEATMEFEENLTGLLSNISKAETKRASSDSQFDCSISVSSAEMTDATSHASVNRSEGIDDAMNRLEARSINFSHVDMTGSTYTNELSVDSSSIVEVEESVTAFLNNIQDHCNSESSINVSTIRTVNLSEQPYQIEVGEDKANIKNVSSQSSCMDVNTSAGDLNDLHEDLSVTDEVEDNITALLNNTKIQNSDVPDVRKKGSVTSSTNVSRDSCLTSDAEESVAIKDSSPDRPRMTYKSIRTVASNDGHEDIIPVEDVENNVFMLSSNADNNNTIMFDASNDCSTTTSINVSQNSCLTSDVEKNATAFLDNIENTSRDDSATSTNNSSGLLNSNNLSEDIEDNITTLLSKIDKDGTSSSFETSSYSNDEEESSVNSRSMELLSPTDTSKDNLDDVVESVSKSTSSLTECFEASLTEVFQKYDGGFVNDGNHRRSTGQLNDQNSNLPPVNLQLRRISLNSSRRRSSILPDSYSENTTSLSTITMTNRLKNVDNSYTEDTREQITEPLKTYKDVEGQLQLLENEINAKFNYIEGMLLDAVDNVRSSAENFDVCSRLVDAIIQSIEEQTPDIEHAERMLSSIKEWDDNIFSSVSIYFKEKVLNEWRDWEQSVALTFMIPYLESMLEEDDEDLVDSLDLLDDCDQFLLDIEDKAAVKVRRKSLQRRADALDESRIHVEALEREISKLEEEIATIELESGNLTSVKLEMQNISEASIEKNSILKSLNENRQLMEIVESLHSWSPVVLESSKVVLNFDNGVLFNSNECLNVTFDISEKSNSVSCNASLKKRYPSKISLSPNDDVVKSKLPSSVQNFVDHEIQSIIDQIEKTILCTAVDILSFLHTIEWKLSRTEQICRDVRKVGRSQNCFVQLNQEKEFSDDNLLALVYVDFTSSTSRDKLRMKFEVGMNYPFGNTDINIDPIIIDKVNVDLLERQLVKNVSSGYGFLTRACDIIEISLG